MKHTAFLFCAAFALLSLPTVASATNYMEQCSKAITYDDIASSNDVAADYALSQTNTSASSTNVNTSASAVIPSSVPIPVSGKGDFAHANSAMSSIGINWSLRESSSYLGRFVSKDGLSAFAQCARAVLAQQGGVQIEVNDMDENSVTLSVHLGSISGTARQFTAKVYTDGNTVVPFDGHYGSGGDTKSITLFRANPAKNVHVQVLAYDDGGTQIGSDDAIIPPFIISSISKPPLEARQSPANTVQCGGVKGKETRVQDQIIMSTAPDEEFIGYQLIKDKSWGEYGVQPAEPPSGLTIQTATPQLIAATITCDVYANEKVWWSGHIVGYVQKQDFVVTPPKDNHVPMPPMHPLS